jgi:membrane-associated phospholipid phosphatase
MAIWGLIGILLPLNKVSEDGALFYPTIAVIVLAGLVMTARLQLQVHSPREMMFGGLLGFGATFVSMTILF